MKKNEIDPKNLMALERATVSLIGVAISLIAFGFVIEKFDLFLYLVSVELKSRHIQMPQKFINLQFYNYLGIIIVISGIIIALYTYKYYTKWIEYLKEGKIDTDKKIYFFLSIFVAVIGTIVLFSMFII